jgi:hypothetical protein
VIIERSEKGWSLTTALAVRMSWLLMAVILTPHAAQEMDEERSYSFPQFQVYLTPVSRIQDIGPEFFMS